MDLELRDRTFVVGGASRGIGRAVADELVAQGARVLIASRGGEALVCELVGYPETRDYVKRILGVRQAYRELRPIGPRRTLR